jgi:hypothetical protein
VGPGTSPTQSPSKRCAATPHAAIRTDARLLTIRPAVERNLAQIEAVRHFEFGGQTGPITIFHSRG